VLLVRAGARSEFGPWFVGAGWKDEAEPALVSDYARELGFAPSADFHQALVGPRPEALLENTLV